MSVRPPRTSKKDQSTRSQPAQMTRRQLTRHEREVRQQRIALFAVVAAVLIALLVPAYGYWRVTYGIGGDPIAVVQGQSISTDLYARLLGYEELLVQRDAKRISDATTAAKDDSTKQSLQLQQQNLQQAASTLSDDALSYLVERPFVLAEAKKRGFTATQQELDHALQQEMTSYPGSGLRFQSLGDPPDSQLASLAQAKADLKTVVGSGQFLTEAQVTDLVLTQRVLRGKLLAALSEGLPTSGDQVHASHILVDTLDAANAARARILAGASFAAVAKDVSTDTGSKDNGGDLGWFAHDQMVTAFADAAFSLQVGEISQPVQSSYGYHIILVQEKQANRPFTSGYMDQQKATKFSDWVTTQEAPAGAVQQLNSSDKVTWAENYVSARMPAQ